MSTETTEVPTDDDATEQPDAEAPGVDAPDGDPQDDAPAPLTPPVPGHGALSIRDGQDGWTPAQREALAAVGVPTVGRDAVPGPVLAQFHHVCQMLGLDPFRREIYLLTHGRVTQDDRGQWRDHREYAVVTGIDGYRAIAATSPQYAGQTEVQWCGEDGQWRDVWSVRANGYPMAARIGIRRKGEPEPTWAVAMWEEYVPTMPVTAIGDDGKPFDTGERVPVPTWQQRGAFMLAKVCESLALRKAFPRLMAGVFVAEEMARAAQDYANDRSGLEADADARAAAAAHVEPAEQVTMPTRVGDTAAQIVARLHERVVQGTVVTDEPPAVTPLPGADATCTWRQEYDAQTSWLGATAAKVADRALRLHKVDTVDALPEDAVARLVRQQRGAVARKVIGSDSVLARWYAARHDDDRPVPLPTA